MAENLQGERQTGQRSCAALLLLLLLSPLFALFAGDRSQALLPACCRMHGQHHCTMPHPDGDGDDAPKLAQIHEHCPYLPALAVSAHVPPVVDRRLALHAVLLVRLSAVRFAAQHYMSPHRGDAYDSRGPPPLHLAA